MRKGGKERDREKQRVGESREVNKPGIEVGGGYFHQHPLPIYPPPIASVPSPITNVFTVY